MFGNENAVHDLDNGTLQPTSYCPDDKWRFSFRSSCEPAIYKIEIRWRKIRYWNKIYQILIPFKSMKINGK